MASCRGIAFASAMLLATLNAGAMEFYPVGLNGEVLGISRDGVYAVGRGSDAPGTCFRWSLASGYESLGPLPDGFTSAYPDNISADGSIISGSVSTGSSAEVMRWTAATGMVAIGSLQGRGYSESISGDGSVVVGGSIYGSGPTTWQGFRWSADSGFSGLGDLPGGIFRSWANAVSSDGNVIVGYSTSGFGTEAFRWTQTLQMVAMGDLDGGGFESSAWGANPDGTVIVGYGTTALGLEAFRWTESAGMVALGELPGGRYQSAAEATSADGSVIVGFSYTANGQEAMVWTAGGGMRLLQDVLSEGTVDMTGWRLTRAYDVSNDGTVIVGYGTDPAGQQHGWVAVIPEPSSLSLMIVAVLALARGVRKMGASGVGASGGDPSGNAQSNREVPAFGRSEDD